MILNIFIFLFSIKFCLYMLNGLMDDTFNFEKGSQFYSNITYI